MIYFKALHRHRRKDNGKICPMPEAQRSGTGTPWLETGPLDRRMPHAESGITYNITQHSSTVLYKSSTNVLMILHPF